jgi:hypothetical protein
VYKTRQDKWQLVAFKGGADSPPHPPPLSLSGFFWSFEAKKQKTNFKRRTSKKKPAEVLQKMHI